MKRKEEIKELTQLNAAELADRVVESRREQLHLRMRRAVSGQVETSHRYRELRQSVARCKTLLRQQQKQTNGEES